MELFNTIVLSIITIIAAISTILLVLDAVGLLPHKISKILIRNKLELTREVLKELGINTLSTKEAISKCLTTESLKRLEDKLKFITYTTETEIGETSRGYFFNSYIDLMGATTNESSARDFAGLLKSYVEKSGCVDLSSINFVVTSKLGSPILGYEFAKNIKKPLLLHSSEEKFRTSSTEYTVQQKFDTGGCTDFQEKTALIVEDSTTGGRKVLDVVEDLRRNGINVYNCLVIFAPQGKNAYEKLLAKQIKLHCMVQTHGEKDEKRS